jgi:hypothetical protein
VGQVAAKVKELENKLAVLMEKKKQAEKEAAEKARLEVSREWRGFPLSRTWVLEVTEAYLGGRCSPHSLLVAPIAGLSVQR